jgi:pyruvate dehydrogenase E2 component (dihydrolipoamide acetyltransferase)/2-oxoglutarate dehydrogenase E2 component (dihydrolipoamide succinyltransferase)
MAAELAIPQLGVTMTEGVLAEWLVEDGATVTVGQPVYLLETDKTEAEIEAPASGMLTIKAQAGDTYDVGTVVGEIS